MTTLPAMPSAMHVATAIVAACRATREDPIECASGKLKMRGRYYAFAALRKLFPETANKLLARMVGVANPHSAASFVATVRQAENCGHWWDDSIVTAVVDAVSPPASSPEDLPRMALRAPKAEVAPRSLPPPRKPFFAEPISRPVPFDRVGSPAGYVSGGGGTHMTSGLMRPDRPAEQRGAVVVPVQGEPEPGRSALDQRRAFEAIRNAAGVRT